MGQGTKEKHFKKARSFYESCFQFHEPFQIIGNQIFANSLVDPEFLKTTLRQRLNIWEEASKILESKSIRLMTTECIKCELREIDQKEQAGCLVACKKYELIRLCKHAPCIPSKECLLEIVKKGVNKFFIASNNPSLKEELRQIPGIPIIFNHHGQVMLEDPSKASLKFSKQASKSKQNLSEREGNILNKLIPLPEQNSKRTIKKRRAKQPNPLSCKKKKAKIQPSKKKDSCN